MAKKVQWAGYKNEQDYFANAPDDLLQKHYKRITDFELAMTFTMLLKQYRNPWPLLQANQAIYDQLGIEGR